MKALLNVLPRASARNVLPLAAVFLALAAVVHASIHRHSGPRAARPTFAISGGLRGPLAPGRSQQIDLVLGNHTRSTLWITDLRVGLQVDATHAAAGCSAERDFTVTQLPAASFPVVLPALRPYQAGWPARFVWNVPRSWPLHDLGVSASPSIAMRDLALTNQDACKGATLRLTFTGGAGNARRRAIRRP